MINYDEKIIYHGVKDSNHRMMLPSHCITKSIGNWYAAMLFFISTYTTHPNLYNIYTLW